MSRKSREPRTSVDSDGVRIESSRRWWAAIAGVFVAALVILAVAIRMTGPEDPEAPPTHAGTPARAKPLAARPAPASSVGRKRLIAEARVAAPSPEVEAVTPLPKDPNVQPPVQADDPIANATMAPTPPPSDYGWKGPGGTALFPPPGTNPPKPGIIVPDDFELPTGYVRYHQTTDDGKDLAPILTFHPDYEFVDEAGQPVQVPADLVVPPELAPPGIPVEILEIPETVYPQGPSQEQIDRFLNEHPELLSGDLSPEEVERIIQEHQESPAAEQK